METGIMARDGAAEPTVPAAKAQPAAEPAGVA
jgi:hypothetical protein